MHPLVKHIKAKNAEAQAWADAAPGRYAGMIVEDLEHWTRDGIDTPAKYDHYMGADLVGSVFPLGGFWVNDNGTFSTFAEVK